MSANNPIDQHYIASSKHLCEQIRHYSPSSIPVLEQIIRECSAQLGYYAAFVLLCLKAKQDKNPARRPDNITLQDVKGFTFFEAAQDHPTALVLFDELLLCYQRDQANPTHLLPHPFGADDTSQSESDSASAG